MDIKEEMEQSLNEQFGNGWRRKQRLWNYAVSAISFLLAIPLIYWIYVTPYLQSHIVKAVLGIIVVVAFYALQRVFRSRWA